MYIFYHGDMDGIVSAHIFLENYLKSFASYVPVIEMREFRYDQEDEVLNIKLNQSKEELVTFVDCCPSKEILNKLLTKTKNITILDHHISKKPIVDELYQEGLIDGMSYVGASASLITYCWWKYKKDLEKTILFLDMFGKSRIAQDKTDIPLSLKLVNSWDIWNGFYSEAEAYKTFFECQNFLPNSKEVKNILENNMEVQRAIVNGNIMLQFYHQWGDQYCKRFGYETRYKGNNFFVLNVGNANSKIFGDRINNYDAVIIYCNDGEQYRCSIYSTKTEFNCANFAEQFGGGGHKGAAGFVLDKLPAWLGKKK